MAHVWRAIQVLMVTAVCSTAPMGCEIPGQDGSSGHDPTPAAAGATEPAATDLGALTNAPASVPATQQVSGDPSEGNSETDNIGNGRIWVNGSGSLGVRCLANDGKADGLPPEYYCDNFVSGAGALKMAVNPDKTIAVLAQDFTSSRSGLIYKFKGFAINSSSSPLVSGNPRILSSGDQNGTFRAYWNTYR
jgi:hypothetical protein